MSIVRPPLVENVLTLALQELKLDLATSVFPGKDDKNPARRGKVGYTDIPSFYLFDHPRTLLADLTPLFTKGQVSRAQFVELVAPPELELKAAGALAASPPSLAAALLDASHVYGTDELRDAGLARVLAALVKITLITLITLTLITITLITLTLIRRRYAARYSTAS
jgi:hypothetical protein